MGARARRAATRSSPRPSIDFGTIDAFVESVAGRNAGRSRTLSGLPRADTCSSSARCGRLAPGERSTSPGSTPDLDVRPARLVPRGRPSLRLAAGAGRDARSRGHRQRRRRVGALGGRACASARRAPADGDTVAEHPPRSWGLAARGATIEAGTPEFDFHLVDKIEVWSDDAGCTSTSRPSPRSGIRRPRSRGTRRSSSPTIVEDAVVQVMTYLIENETAALIVPSRFIAQLHPHFREVMQVLAVQAADEARHIEVFTRRARLKRSQLGLSTIGGQASLKTLVDEPRVRDRVIPAVGARRGHVPVAALVHRAICAGPRHGGRGQARGAGRGATRRVRPRASRPAFEP